MKTQTIAEFMAELYRRTDPEKSHYEKTCDVLKAGDPDCTVSKVATTMFGTPDVMRAAAAWGANLLIVHEPFAYNHWDDPAEYTKASGFKGAVMEAKRSLARELGLTIYRYHDHPHCKLADMIAEGEVARMGLIGTWRMGQRPAVSYLELDEPMEVMQLAETIERNLQIAHVRVCGNHHFKAKKLALYFGTPGGIEASLDHNDVCLTGEICEWAIAELLHDSAQLGYEKAIIVMGHECSEREGMRALVDFIAQNFPSIEAKYFESADPYYYTDKTHVSR